MNLGFVFEPLGPIAVVILALCVTVALGLAGTLGRAQPETRLRVAESVKNADKCGA